MILVYGGSFNPPTVAHQEIIKKLCETYQPKNIIVVPVGDDYNKPQLAPFYHRVAMLKLIMEPLPCQVEILTREGEAPFDGTYNTLKYVSSLYPNEDIHFVLGTDHLASIESWIEADKLLKEYAFIVVRRKNYTPNYSLLKKHDTVYEVFDYDNDVAATKFRMNQEKYQDIVTDQVLAYIKVHHLY